MTSKSRWAIVTASALLRLGIASIGILNLLGALFFASTALQDLPGYAQVISGVTCIAIAFFPPWRQRKSFVPIWIVGIAVLAGTSLVAIFLPIGNSAPNNYALRLLTSNFLALGICLLYEPTNSGDGTLHTE